MFGKRKTTTSIAADQLLQLRADYAHGGFLLMGIRRAELIGRPIDEQAPYKAAFVTFALTVNKILEQRGVANIEELPSSVLTRVNALHTAIFSDESERDALISRLPKEDQINFLEISNEMKNARADLQRREKQSLHKRNERTHAFANALSEFSVENLYDHFFQLGYSNFHRGLATGKSEEVWSYAKKLSCSTPIFEAPQHRFLFGHTCKMLEPISKEQVDTVVSEYSLYFEETKRLEPISLSPLLDHFRQTGEEIWSPVLLVRYLNSIAWLGKEQTFSYAMTSHEKPEWQLISLSCCVSDFEGIPCKLPRVTTSRLSGPNFAHGNIRVLARGTRTRVHEIELHGEAQNSQDSSYEFFKAAEAIISDYFGAPFSNQHIDELKSGASSNRNLQMQFTEEVKRPHFSEPDWLYLNLKIKAER